jgi:hypothetical protein
LKKSEIFEIFKLIALLKTILNFGHLFSKNHISVSVHDVTCLPAWCRV